MPSYFSRYSGDPYSEENVADDMGLHHSMYFAEGGQVPDGGDVLDLIGQGYAGGGLVRRLANAIRAYHGSPHDFDKFDASKIGTGEGAQAYGHGIYLAENPQVAESYKRAGPYATREVDVINGQLTRISRELDQYRGGTWDKFTDPKGYELKAQYDALMQKRSDLGHMYEVNIHEDPARFLDWDKPLSAQPAPAQEAYRALYKDGTPSARLDVPVDPALGQFIADVPGGQMYRNIGASEGNPALGAAFMPSYATNYLRDAGIPGIRYLDQGSRSAGEGTSNYVIFPGMEDIIEIARKYAQGGQVEADDFNLYQSQYYNHGGAVEEPVAGYWSRR